MGARPFPSLWLPIIKSLLMKHPKRKSRTFLSPTTDPCSSLILVATSPRSSAGQELGPDTKSPTVNLETLDPSAILFLLPSPRTRILVPSFDSHLHISIP